MFVNWALPLEDRLIELKLWPYSAKGNGSDIVVTQSSQWLKVSVVPGTMLPPICCIISGGQDANGVGVGVGVNVAVGDGLAVGLGVGVGLAVGLGVGVPPAGACIATVMGEPVLKKPTVARAFCGG